VTAGHVRNEPTHDGQTRGAATWQIP